MNNRFSRKRSGHEQEMNRDRYESQASGPRDQPRSRFEDSHHDRDFEASGMNRGEHGSRGAPHEHWSSDSRAHDEASQGGRGRRSDNVTDDRDRWRANEQGHQGRDDQAIRHGRGGYGQSSSERENTGYWNRNESQSASTRFATGRGSEYEGYRASEDYRGQGYGGVHGLDDRDYEGNGRYANEANSNTENYGGYGGRSMARGGGFPRDDFDQRGSSGFEMNAEHGGGRYAEERDRNSAAYPRDYTAGERGSRHYGAREFGARSYGDPTRFGMRDYEGRGYRYENEQYLSRDFDRGGTPGASYPGTTGERWAGRRESFPQQATASFNEPMRHGYGGSMSGTRPFGQLEGGEPIPTPVPWRGYGGSAPSPFYTQDFNRTGTSMRGPMGEARRFKGPKGYTRSDERIKEDVSEQLAQADDIDVSDIEVSVAKGEVTLSGSLPDRRMKYIVEHLVDSISGVTEIHNQLRIKRESATNATSSVADKSTAKDGANTNTSTNTNANAVTADATNYPPVTAPAGSSTENGRRGGMRS